MKSSSNKQESRANDLIRRWLANEVEWQEVERAAQNDKFLQEALEGYQAVAKNEQAERLHQLRIKLRNRYQRTTRRRVLFYLPRVAAAVVLLFVLSWWWTTLSDTTTSDRIAEQNKPTQEQQADPDQLQTKGGDMASPPTEVEEAASSLTQSETDPAPAEELEQNSADVLAKAEAETNNEAISQPLAESAREVVESSELALQDDVSTPSAYDARPSARRAVPKTEGEGEGFRSRLSVRSLTPMRFLQGKVFDQQGKPLVDADILVGEKTTTTDSTGRFGMTIPPTDSVLTAFYPGFLDTTVSIVEQDSMTIILRKE